jgi:hypothetical protein
VKQNIPWILMVIAVGCSGTTTAVVQETVPVRANALAQTATQPASETFEAQCASNTSGVQIEGQLGTLAPARVRNALHDAEPRLTACFTHRLEALPCLAGSVRFKIRVALDGAVQYAIPTTSSMGDRETEQCMQRELAHLDFGRPCGGEAEVTWGIELDGGPDARAATSWPSTRMDVVMRQRRAAITACRHGNATPISVTLYAAMDGSIAASGGSIANAEIEPIVDCVTREVRGWRVPSPGSWYAKTTINIP